MRNLYTVRICMEDGNAYQGPTVTLETYDEAMAVAKPWIDGEYNVEIAPVTAPDDPFEEDKIYMPVSLHGMVKELTSEQAGQLFKAIFAYVAGKDGSVEGEEVFQVIAEQLTKLFENKEVE